QFWNFWNWYSVEYPVENFSRYTQQYLEELFYTREIEETWIIIFKLIFNPFTVLYIASEITSPVSSDDSFGLDNPEILNDPNFNNLLFNTEPLNIEQLFKEENPMAA
ncbi:14715_t:CDS:2, partial [Funneliformis geosporum]